MEWNKNKERNEQIRLLRKSGLSIGAIAKKLNCSKSTVTLHAKSVILDEDQLKILKDNDLNNRFSKNNIGKITNINNSVWKYRRLLVINEAIKEWSNYKDNCQILLFLGLYWGEGTKSINCSQVSIVNNDPGVLKTAFDIIKVLSNKNIEIKIRCYPDVDLEESKKYWESIFGYVTNIKYRKENGKRRKPTSKYGTCTISVSDWELRYKIITWLDLLRKEKLPDTNVLHITDFHGYYKNRV